MLVFNLSSDVSILLCFKMGSILFLLPLSLTITYFTIDFFDTSQQNILIDESKKGSVVGFFFPWVSGVPEARWCDVDGWCHDIVMKVMCHDNYSLQQLWQVWRKKCVSWFPCLGLASICFWCTQYDDELVWITTQILYDRTKNKYYFCPKTGGGGWRCIFAALSRHWDLLYPCMGHQTRLQSQPVGGGLKKRNKIRKIS